MDYGFVKVFRRDLDLFDRGEFDDCHAFIYLTARANYEPSIRVFNDIVVNLDRGQLITSVDALSKRFRWSAKKVRCFLGRLEEMV